MNHMAIFEYETDHWPSLREALHLLFTQNPGNKLHISYEKTYSCVYKCACNHYTPRLFKDLYNEIQIIMDILNRNLQDAESTELVKTFSLILQQFHCASKAILLIFSYMSRMENQIEDELKSKLAAMFTSLVVDVHLTRVIDVLKQAQQIPFLLAPEITSCVVLSLHSLNPAYARLAPEIFAQYVPNLLPQLTLDDLPIAIYQTKVLQEELIINGFNREANNKKRRGDEDESTNKKNNGGVFPSDSNDNMITMEY